MSEVFNVSANPHVRSKDTTQTIMRDVLIALTPASIFGIYNFGLGALIRIIVGIAACVASEALYEYFMHKKITVSDLSAAVTGLLIALNIPSTLNVGYEIVGCVFAIIIVKQLFGGLGQNFMNPALAARCFLLIAFTGPMTNFVTDTFSGATPLAVLKPGAEPGTERILGTCLFWYRRIICAHPKDGVFAGFIEVDELVINCNHSFFHLTQAAGCAAILMLNRLDSDVSTNCS